MESASHAPGMAFVFYEHIFEGRGVGNWRGWSGGMAGALTLFIGLIALAANAFSLLILRHLSSLSSGESNVFIVLTTLYLYLASILVLFGIIGAIRQHARYITIFSRFLTLDTLLSTLGRVLTLAMIFEPAAHICTAAVAPSRSMAPVNAQSGDGYGFAGGDGKARAGAYTEWWAQAGRWEHFERCERATLMIRTLLCLGVVVAAVLQVLAIMHVRRYASELRARQRRLKQAEDWVEGGERSLRLREADREIGI